MGSVNVKVEDISDTAKPPLTATSTLKIVESSANVSVVLGSAAPWGQLHNLPPWGSTLGPVVSGLTRSYSVVGDVVACASAWGRAPSATYLDFSSFSGGLAASTWLSASAQQPALQPALPSSVLRLEKGEYVLRNVTELFLCFFFHSF